LPSEQKLADRYGVSRITVRRAIEVLEEDGQVERQHGRGTFVRETIPKGTLLYVGRTHDHFYRGLYAALQRQAQQRGRALGAFSPEHEEESIDGSDHLRELLEEAGAVICQEFCWPEVDAVLSADRPVVQLTGWQGDGRSRPEGRPTYVVSTDTFAAAHLVTEHLLDLGHERIAYFGAGTPTGDTDEMLWEPRRNTNAHRGYELALREQDLGLPPGIGFPERHQRDWHMASEEAIRRFVEREGWPTAFVCEGDFRASPLLRMAMEMGVNVPDELSVVGMCNTPWSEMLAPQLTSVDLREEEMAHLASVLVDEAPPEETTVFRVEPLLIERGSTAPPRG
jgi:DNA-binding LacI/PurR family transcriptional regulator